jgi:hypothetical protein
MTLPIVHVGGSRYRFGLDHFEAKSPADAQYWGLVKIRFLASLLVNKVNNQYFASLDAKEQYAALVVQRALRRKGTR